MIGPAWARWFPRCGCFTMSQAGATVSTSRRRWSTGWRGGASFVVAALYLVIVTVTGADVAALPATSVATAVRRCRATDAFRVFQLTAYGAVVSTPIWLPSTMNATR